MNRAFGGLLACACLSIAGPIQAEDKQQFWPELAAFVQLNDRARACFDVAYSASEWARRESAGIYQPSLHRHFNSRAVSVAAAGRTH